MCMVLASLNLIIICMVLINPMLASLREREGERERGREGERERGGEGERERGRERERERGSNRKTSKSLSCGHY